MNKLIFAIIGAVLLLAVLLPTVTWAIWNHHVVPLTGLPGLSWWRTWCLLILLGHISYTVRGPTKFGGKSR